MNAFRNRQDGRSPWAKLLCLFSLVGIVGVLAACGGSDDSGSSNGDSDSAAAETGPIKIGFTESLSGPLATYGNLHLEAAKMAVADQNKKGGVLGRKLELVVNDDKSDINLVERRAQELLDQDIDFLRPACDYDLGAPAAKLANDANVISISCPGSPLFGAQGVGPLVYNSFQANPTEGAVLASYAKQQGFKKPYLLEDTSIEYSKNLCQYFEESWKEMTGTDVAGRDTFLNDDQSVASQVTRIKGSEADSVMLCSYMPGGATAIRQMRQGGVDLPTLGGVAFDGTYWADAVPNLSNFSFAAVAALVDDPDKDVADFLKRYEKQTGEAPLNVYPVMSYSEIETLVKAIEEAGTTETEAVAEALNSWEDVELLIGPTTYTEDCHVPLGRPMRMMEFVDGELEYRETVKPEFVPESPC